MNDVTSEEMTDQIHRDQCLFYEMMGRCISRWAYVDRSLFYLCQHSLGINGKMASIVFYRINGVSGHIYLVDELLTAFLPPNRLEEWKGLKNDAIELVPVRNLIAHHPLSQIGTMTVESSGELSGDVTSRSYLRLSVEAMELQRGKKKNMTTELADLERHCASAEKLSHSLHEFFLSLAPQAPQ